MPKKIERAPFARSFRWLDSALVVSVESGPFSVSFLFWRNRVVHFSLNTFFTSQKAPTENALITRSASRCSLTLRRRFLKKNNANLIFS